MSKFNFHAGILADWQIRELAIQHEVITPFSESVSGDGVISYGLTSYGYDARLGYVFKVCEGLNTKNDLNQVINPKGIDNELFGDFYNGLNEPLAIPPNSFALAETVEYFQIPRSVVCVCLGKSTYARCGIIVNVTPLEPGWCGKVTVEISNSTPRPVLVYPGEGIMQIQFHLAGSECELSYADKKGKYQFQQGLTMPIVK